MTYTKLLKGNEKFLSKITVLMCVTTLRVMALRQRISWSCCVIHYLKVILSQNLVGLVE